MKIKIIASKSKSASVAKENISLQEAAIVRKAVAAISVLRQVEEFKKACGGKTLVTWQQQGKVCVGVLKDEGAKSLSCEVEPLLSPKDDVAMDLTYPLNGYRLSGNRVVLAKAAVTKITLEEFLYKKGKFDENQHPRDNSGRFTSGGSGGRGGNKPKDRSAHRELTDAYVSLVRSLKDKPKITDDHIEAVERLRDATELEARDADDKDKEKLSALADRMNNQARDMRKDREVYDDTYALLEQSGYEDNEDTEDEDEEEGFGSSDYEINSLKLDTASALDDAFSDEDSEMSLAKEKATPQAIINALNNSEAGLGEFSSRSNDKDLAKAIERHIESSDPDSDDVIAVFHSAAMLDIESVMDRDEVYDQFGDAAPSAEMAVNETTDAWVVEKLIEIIRSTAKAKKGKFEESRHPRDRSGRFSSGSGNSSNRDEEDDDVDYDQEDIEMEDYEEVLGEYRKLQKELKEIKQEGEPKTSKEAEERIAQLSKLADSLRDNMDYAEAINHDYYPKIRATLREVEVALRKAEADQGSKPLTGLERRLRRRDEFLEKLREGRSKGGKFDESRHPRDSSGRFSSGNSESQSKDDEEEKDYDYWKDKDILGKDSDEYMDYLKNRNSKPDPAMQALDDLIKGGADLDEVKEAVAKLGGVDADAEELTRNYSSNEEFISLERAVRDVIGKRDPKTRSEFRERIEELEELAGEIESAIDEAKGRGENTQNLSKIFRRVERELSNVKRDNPYRKLDKHSKATLSLIPTEAMAAEARKGLEWRKEFKRGGTMVGVSRARDLSNRAELSESTIGRMVSYFARHEVDKQAEGFNQGEKGFPSAGRIAWALWGGDAGKTWAEAMQERIKKRKESKGYYGKDKDKKEYNGDDNDDSDYTEEDYDDAKDTLMSALRSGKLSKDSSYDDMCGYLKDRGYPKALAEKIAGKMSDGYKMPTRKPSIKRK